MTLSVGFTGTRLGLLQQQGARVAALLDEHRPSVAHHGCCIGADEDFHAICRERKINVVGHPGPGWPDGPLCAYTICGNTIEPTTYARRNAAIVAASSIMIAAPFESEPQRRGGTWMTIRMAMHAVRAGKLRALYVVGRDGKLLAWEGWR